MGFRYRVKTKKDTINKEAVPKYYAVPVRSGKVDITHMAEVLSDRSSLTPGDIQATIIGLVDIMESYLHQGYSVELDNIGIFTLSVTSDGYETPKDCTPHRVRAQKVCFRAAPKLKKNLKYVKFERDK